MNIDLFPHQVEAIPKLHNGSILTGGVGSGKSRTALVYFFIKECQGLLKINGVGQVGEMKTPKDLYIITTAKKRDSLEWEEEAAAFGLSRVPEISFGNVKLTVDSWNNIDNYTKVEGAVFLLDEQRLVGSGAWSKAFLKIAEKNAWILLSATPGDQWIEYVPVFVANGFFKNRTEFIEKHVVYNRFSKFPKIDRYVNQGPLLKYRDQILVEMPFERHTVRHVRQILVEHDEVLYERVKKDRWHIYEDRPLRDAGEMVSVMRKLVNSDPSRLGAVMQLLEKHPRLIIFYNFNYELEALRTLGGILNIESREWNGQLHEALPEGDRWIYLVQYTAGSEGWNAISTDATVFYSLNYSYKINEQAKGRIDRLNTPFTDLWYYVLRSKADIDSAITRAIAKKKNFNEKKFRGDWEVSDAELELEKKFAA